MARKAPLRKSDSSSKFHHEDMGNKRSQTNFIEIIPVFLSLATSARWATWRAFVRGSSLTWAWLGARSALECGRHDFRGKVEEVAEVLDTLVSQIPNNRTKTYNREAVTPIKAPSDL